jgi:hypothetical protein
MSVMMFRATIKEEHLADIEAALKTMFAAINAHQPPGVRYASSRVGDTSTYMILLALDQPGDNPLTAIPEFRAFQGQIQGWLAEPTVPQPLTVMGSYNLF